MSFRNGVWVDPDQAELDRIRNSILYPQEPQPVTPQVPANFQEVLSNIVDSAVESTKIFINKKVYAQTKKLKNLFDKKVDIVIPVYNAIHLTEECIRKVYERTDWPFHLTVIDDASNKRANEILQSLQAEFGFDLLVNKKNHGFAASVNKAVKNGSNPYIVLLNSDVLVTDGWLSKMLLAIEDDPRNQIVNPATNNTAQININMYPGYSYLAMNKALETYSERRYPEIMPTGFCYMVKRKLFKQLGYFSPNFIQFGEEALDIATPIATSKGWKTIREIQTEDEVFTIDGQRTKVIKATKIIHNRPCYRFTFNNGHSVVSDAGHKWQVLDRMNRMKEKVLTSQEIATSKEMNQKYLKRYYIALSKPVEFPDNAHSLPIDPYVLGAWLGDGASSGAIMTSNDPEIFDSFIAAGWAVKKWNTPYGYGISNPNPVSRFRDRSGRFLKSKGTSFRSALRGAGVLDNKHIPIAYELASLADRLAILQGLMDTDGHIGPSGRCTFANTNKQIIDAVYRIISSMGLYCSVVSCKVKFEGCAPSWKIHFRVDSYDFPVFRLKRKLERQLNSKRKTFAGRHLRISKIEKVDSRPVKCLEVEHPSHLFLCGEAFIPTHNSSSYMQTVTHTDNLTYPHYRAVMADDTYVFHQRNVSFASLGEDESMKLRKKASAKFHKLWPQFPAVNAAVNSAKELDVLRAPLSIAHLNALTESRYSICWLVHSVEMCGGMKYIADIVNEINERGGDARVALIKRQKEMVVNPIAELRVAPIVFDSYEEAVATFKTAVFDKGVVVASTVELSDTVNRICDNEDLKPLLHVQSYEPDLVEDPALKLQVKEQFKVIPNVISSSGWVAEQLESDGVPVFDAIWPGVDNKIFYPRGRASGDDRPTVMISARRSYAFKGYERAVQLIKYIHHIAESKNFDVRILTYGVEDMPEAQEAICLGPLSQVRLAETLGKEVDVFIDPSNIHSYGLPALEALVSGCAVVSWDNKGINEYVESGVNGVIFPADATPAEVALKIVKLLASPSERLKIAANFGQDEHCRTKSVDSFIKAVEKHFQIVDYKKILVMTPHLRKHGGPTTILDIANGLKEHGHDVTIGTTYSDIEYDVGKFTDIPVRMFDLGNLNMSQQSNIIEDRIPEVDVIISNSDNPINHILVNSKKAKQKIMLKLSHNERFKALEEQGMQLPWDAVLTSSDWLKDVCHNVTRGWNYKPYPEDKVHRIGWSHYGHQTMNFPPFNKDFSPEKTVVIATLIHAHPSKGTIDALKVLDAVHKLHGNKVQFLGIGEVHPKQLDIKLPNYVYQYAPTRDKMAALLAKTDIWLGASHSEGLGRMALECMSASVVPVLSNTNPEYAVHGENAYLSPVGDLKQLAHLVSYLVAHPETRQVMASNAYKTACEASDKRQDIIEKINKVMTNV